MKNNTTLYHVEKTNKGHAVYTDHDIPPNKRLFEFTGKLYTREEYIEMLEHDNNHFLQVEDNLFMGPSNQNDDYVNHSCNPNCGLKYLDDGIFLYSIKYIKSGEELTFDYSTTMDEDHWTMNCLCGSENCRGLIRDFKLLSDDLKQRYFDLAIVPDFIRKKYTTG